LYNTVHRHSGIGFMTPYAVHYGTAQTLHQHRAQTLQAAFVANPLRFKGIVPTPPALPTAAWINPPKEAVASQIPTDSSLIN
jgi:putative transposase